MPNVAPGQIILLGTFNLDGTVTGVTTGTSIPIDCAGFGVVSFYLRSVGTTSGGTVLIEEADYGPSEAPYSGTWSQNNSTSASTFTGTAQTSVHIVNTAFAYMRVRISSTITGGGTILVTCRRQGGA